MAGTPKSVLGQVQKDPMQGYKGVGSYQPSVVGMATGGGYSRDNTPDHTHPELQNIAQRINAPQIPGLLANTDMPAKYPDITFDDPFQGGSLLDNISSAPHQEMVQAVGLPENKPKLSYLEQISAQLGQNYVPNGAMKRYTIYN
tara:strand:+ start:78 stop:509 length:432 start_codon:yes stop_codon:yes gene_type:complete